MAARCPDCAAGLDHCHGTLVLHSDGSVECTDLTCVVHDAERHVLVIRCTEIGPDCACLGFA